MKFKVSDTKTPQSLKPCICLSITVNKPFARSGHMVREKIMLPRNRPFARNDHMAQNPPYWRASSLLFPHWDVKTKRPQSVKSDCLLFICPSAAIIMTCPPAWRILYHVTVCCKRPMALFTVNFCYLHCNVIQRGC